jgi:hypothetical protein
MKIGVYGDSYADFHPQSDPYSWASYLQQMFDGNIEIFNYARTGSSVYFSYQNFLKSYYLYDLIIFLVTNPNRYPGVFQITASKINHYISCLEQIELLENSEKLTFEEKTFLNDLKGWFNASSQEYHQDMSDLMLDDIEHKHTNLIIYPCFYNSFKKERFTKYNLDPMLHPMHSFWVRQNRLLGIKSDTFVPIEKSTVAGHLVPEFNEYFAKVLYSKIKKGLWDHSGLGGIRIKHSKTHYYKNWD